MRGRIHSYEDNRTVHPHSYWHRSSSCPVCACLICISNNINYNWIEITRTQMYTLYTLVCHEIVSFRSVCVFRYTCLMLYFKSVYVVMLKWLTLSKYLWVTFGFQFCIMYLHQFVMLLIKWVSYTYIYSLFKLWPLLFNLL